MTIVNIRFVNESDEDRDTYEFQVDSNTESYQNLKKNLEKKEKSEFISRLSISPYSGILTANQCLDEIRCIFGEDDE